jgi:hypothetical protein
MSSTGNHCHKTRGEEMEAKHISDAYQTLRTHNHSIPDDVLDRMKLALLAHDDLVKALLTAERFLTNQSYNAAQLAEAVTEIRAALSRAGAIHDHH